MKNQFISCVNNADDRICKQMVENRLFLGPKALQYDYRVFSIFLDNNSDKPASK